MRKMPRETSSIVRKILANDSTSKRVHPARIIRSILILGIVPLGISIAVITKKVLRMNQNSSGRKEGPSHPPRKKGVEFDVDSQKHRTESHPGVLGYPPRHELGVGLREVEGNPLKLCEGSDEE